MRLALQQPGPNWLRLTDAVVLVAGGAERDAASHPAIAEHSVEKIGDRASLVALIEREPERDAGQLPTTVTREANGHCGSRFFGSTKTAENSEGLCCFFVAHRVANPGFPRRARGRSARQFHPSSCPLGKRSRCLAASRPVAAYRISMPLGAAPSVVRASRNRNFESTSLRRSGGGQNNDPSLID
jgi:hypothetical protein